MPVFLTPEQLAARTKRNRWIAIGLIAFIVLVFTTTLLRMQANVAERTAQEQRAVAATASTPAAPARGGA